MIDNVIDLSKQLIAIPSINNDYPNQAKAISFCKRLLKGFSVEEFESQSSKSLLVYNTDKRPKKFRLILNSHLDVVPGLDNQFQPLIKHNRLYGRGAYDMKAAAIVQLLVFKDIASQIDKPIALQLVTDEETGGFNGTKHQVEDYAVRADFVITGEPTNLDIKNQAKGILWLNIKSKGETAHGAYPWLGDNAIWEMHKLLDKLQVKYPVPKREVWLTTMNLAGISSSNQTYNKVPDECEIKLDFRFIEEDKNTLLREIEKLIPRTFTMTVVENESSHYTSPDNQDLIKLKHLIKSSGHNPKLIKAQGGSDLRHFSRVGCAGIEFGPSGKGHHSDEEYVEIESLDKYYQILKQFILDL